MISARSLAAALLVGALSGAGPAAAEEPLPRTHLKVSGGTSMLNPYRYHERPFWEETVAERSGGRVTADISAHDELGLKGPEILRLLSMGVLDVAHGTISYMAGDEPAFEGLDLPGLTLDIETAREAADAYKPVLSGIMEDEHNVKLLTFSPVTMQVLYCREPIERLADLEGKKVRVFNVTMADYVEAVGGATVNIPFVEVLPAMQRGVADCAITGTATGNTARWWEVMDYLYTMPLGWSMTFFGANLDTWNDLDPAVREFLEEELAKLEDDLWRQAAADVQDGIECNTATGPCDDGIAAEPPMTLVEPSPEDIELHRELLRETVVPRWAERCGRECAEEWTETIGEVVDMTAPAG